MTDQKPADPRRLDVLAFARAQRSAQGRLRLDELPRLRDSVLPPAEGEAPPAFEWSVAGSFRQPVGREAQLRLHLRAGGVVRVTCQRCLEPLAVTLAVDNRLRFVEGEDEAQKLDELTDDEDVLALQPRLDLIELIEDELILTLPLVPRHERCRVTLPARAADDGADDNPAPPAPSPFAALARLRGRAQD